MQREGCASPGQDGHDRGAKVIASSFGDLGFDVIAGHYSFETPAEAAVIAHSRQHHMLGVSSFAAGHATLVPRVIYELKVAGAPHVDAVCAAVVPPQG
ncbi:methylmalonyl-CoA mutase cobalamin-binding domain/chain [Bradyrhizobium sp. GM24.11]